MDFSKLDTVKAAKKTFRFEVIHLVTGEGTGAFIDVYSSESNAVHRFEDNQIINYQKRNDANKLARKPKYIRRSDMDDVKLESALARIAGWENIEWEGKQLEFNEENARKLLTSCPWLREQIIGNSDDAGNFLEA